jgi:hypothetical protein
MEENENKEATGNDGETERNILEDDPENPWVKIIWDGEDKPFPTVKITN